MNVVTQGIEDVIGRGICVRWYELAGGVERCVYALAVEGGQELVDVPVNGSQGQMFTVDPCWRNDGTLGSFLDDYVVIAERLGCPPVSPEVEQGGLDCYEDDDVIELLYRIGRS